ncbi:TssF-like type VI secretion system baseplate subunit (plasmid) [Candidatus Trichorickettsia mobilis]|uniref:type VI secretion system baseplate subunit TssF n=1 Tax=Candidatus Trichorickettsia mobilis TaxID=1346319 RepID=UPI002B256C9B|nr:type VI secretion system baseplate subunit TssF [Candidatus Trichorickettsia mobilis]WPY01670.1 TssF-like type VI secretion system baseplate subunit [Candidatus Trichorickettsia mobilis]
MSNILSYYKNELESLHREIKGFTDSHPTLGAGAAHNILDNPHVALLIETFSLLHANLNLKLEESFIEFISNLFNILYPHYNSPIPSMAIIEIKPSDKAKAPFYLPKGKILELGRNSKESCNFQTCYEATILPVQVTKAYCHDSTTHNNIGNLNAKNLLSIHLAALNKTEFNKLNLNKLRFFIQGSQELKYAIYQVIVTQVLTITIADPDNNDNYIILDKDCIKKVGFAEEENIFPANPNSFIGYRLITEFSAFPDKFLFFDVNLTNSNNLINFTNNIELHFYLGSTKLQNLVSANNFVLNTVPIINLSTVESDPISLSGNNIEYPIIIDHKAPESYEIYSIEKATLVSKEVEKQGFALWNTDYRRNYENSNLFWYSTSRKKLINENVGKKTELYISIIDKDLSFIEESKQYCYLEVKCFNNNLPYTIYSNGITKFTFADHTLPINNIDCLIKPNRANNPLKDEAQKWDMIAHMSPHYLNIMNDTYGKSLLKQLLSMYDFNINNINKLIIENIINVKIREVVKKIKIDKSYQFCKGKVIELYFNELPLPEGVVLLFLSVLEYLLAAYCSINSFTQLVAQNNKNQIIYHGDLMNGLKCVI